MAIPDNKMSRTISFPRQLVPALEAHARRYGAKRQWLIWASGFVAFCRMTEQERDRIIAEINAEDFPGGSFLKLLDRQPQPLHGIVSEDHPPLKRRPSSHHQPTPRKARS